MKYRGTSRLTGTRSSRIDAPPLISRGSHEAAWLASREQRGNSAAYAHAKQGRRERELTRFSAPWSLRRRFATVSTSSFFSSPPSPAPRRGPRRSHALIKCARPVPFARAKPSLHLHARLLEAATCSGGHRAHEFIPRVLCSGKERKERDDSQITLLYHWTSSWRR